MLRRSPLKATRQVRHRRRMLVFKLALWPVFLVIILFVLIWLSKQDFLNVKSVEVSSSGLVDGSEIKSKALDIISKNAFFFFPKTNRFLIPKDEIESAVLEDFPRVGSIDVKIDSDKLLLTIVEREPSYLWCNLGEARDCFLVDESGFAYAPAPTFSGRSFFEFKLSFDNTSPLGRNILPTEDFQSYARFVSSVKRLGIKMNYLLLTEDRALLELSSKTAILFKPKQDLVLLAENIKLIQGNTRLLSDDSLSELEYIDLRFGNKVYYKYVGDNQVQSN